MTYCDENGLPFTGITINGPDEDFPGCIQHWLNGVPHRTDGPAIIWQDGSEFYYLNGEPHRVGGPAKVWTATGLEQWFIHGELKRMQQGTHVYFDELTA